jgi:hypothetical protein
MCGMRTRTILVALTALAALAVAACGGDDPSSPSSTRASARKALLDYARCMREHGVDMPDPKFTGNGVMFGTRTDGKVDEAKMRAADRVCAHYRDAFKPPPSTPAERARARQAALANARCMREHGIDMPDPTFDSSGRATLKFDKGSGIDPNSPRFQAAQKACQKTMPKAGHILNSGGGQ